MRVRRVQDAGGRRLHLRHTVHDADGQRRRRVLDSQQDGQRAGRVQGARRAARTTSSPAKSCVCASSTERSHPTDAGVARFEAWQIGFDGINTLKPLYIDMSGSGVTKITPENLFSSPIRLAAQANRIELLLQRRTSGNVYALIAGNRPTSFRRRAESSISHGSWSAAVR